MNKRVSLGFLIAIVAVFFVVQAQYSTLAVSNTQESEKIYDMAVLPDMSDQIVPDEVDDYAGIPDEEYADSGQQTNNKRIMETAKIPTKEPSENTPMNEAEQLPMNQEDVGRDDQTDNSQDPELDSEQFNQSANNEAVLCGDPSGIGTKVETKTETEAETETESEFESESESESGPSGDQSESPSNENDGKENNEQATPETTKKFEPGIVLTFDDNFVNQWHSFLDLSYGYGAKATFYVCYANKFTDDQMIKLAELQAANNEIGYHTLNHVNLVNYAQHSTLNKVIETEIIPGIQILRERGLNINSFAYPYGAGNHALDQELLKHFSNVRYTAYTLPNQRIKDVNSVYVTRGVPQITYAMGIDNQYGHSLEEIFEGIDRAHNRHEILLLYAHSIADNLDGYVTSMKTLEEIAKYVVEKQMKFYTVSELAEL